MDAQRLKKIIRLVLAAAVIFLAVKWCSGSFGSVISLPGGSGGSGGTGSSGSEGSGGWFSPKNQPSGTASDQDPDIEDLERELGVGKYKGQTSTTTTPSTTSTTTPSSSSSPLAFKGIPMTGSLSAFTAKLTEAGFKSAGNGTYTGDFAGYSGCKVTPTGNPIQEVRVDFPVISDWNALEEAYESLKASLTKKYGIEPDGNPATSNVAVYEVPGGTITLDAETSNRSTWHVILKYTNALTKISTGGMVRNPIDDL